MGRFYRTAKPVFVPNVAYQAPLELMLRGITQDNAIRDAAMKIAEESRAGLQAQQYYNDSEGIEKARLQERQQYYENEIDQIVDLINTSTNYSGLSQAQSKVSNELLNDMRTGELSKIAARYAGYSALMDDYKKTAETDAYTANHVLNWELQQLDKAVSDNRSSYSHNKMIAKPQLEKEFLDMVKAMKADKTFELADGRIITTEFLDENTLHQLALNELMSRPEYNSYVQQGVRTGMQGIVDANGNVIQPYGIYDASGRKRTAEDLANYRESIAKNGAILQDPNSSQSDKETAISELSKLQQEDIRQGLNSEWAFYHDINKAGAFAYTQRDIKADQIEMQRRQFEHNKQMEGIKQQNREIMEAIKQENRIKLKEMEYGEEGGDITNADGNPVTFNMATSSITTHSFAQPGNTKEEKYIDEQANNLWREQMTQYLNAIINEESDSIIQNDLQALKTKINNPNYQISQEQFERDLMQVKNNSEHHVEGKVGAYDLTLLNAIMHTNPYDETRLSRADYAKNKFNNTINDIRKYNKGLMSSISEQVSNVEIPSEMVYTKLDEDELKHLNMIMRSAGSNIYNVSGSDKSVVTNAIEKENVIKGILQSNEEGQLVSYVGKSAYGDPTVCFTDMNSGKTYMLKMQDDIHNEELNIVVTDNLQKVYNAATIQGKALLEVSQDVKYRNPRSRAKDLLKRDLSFANRNSYSKTIKSEDTINTLKMYLPDDATDKQITINKSNEYNGVYVLKYSYKNESKEAVTGEIKFVQNNIGDLLDELSSTDIEN